MLHWGKTDAECIIIVFKMNYIKKVSANGPKN